MRLRFWLGYAAVIAIAVGALATALVVHERETESFERAQRGEATRSARQAESLARLSIGQLASAAAFYRVEGTFSRHEFDAVARSLLHSGALSATAFLQAVAPAGRARFERSHGFAISRRSVLGDLRREGVRERYFPLVFADTRAPLDVQTPFGYDVGSDPLRAADLLRARDTGRPAATRVIRLPVGGTGINVFGPVYRDGAPIATVAERRAALVGFATGAFQVSDLTAAATTALPDEVDVQLLGGGRTVVGPQLDREEAAAASFRIADRTWLLVVRDPRRPGVSLPVLIAVVGVALAALLGALMLIWNRSERMQELQRQASQDPLTGLKNRRRFEEDLQSEIARCRREGGEGALLMLDLDNFKQVNDTLGHPVGDRVIAENAGVLRSRMRITDVLARIGGDEFAIVLPRCDASEARAVAESVASAVREHAPLEEGVPPITVSIGIAMFGADPQVGAASIREEADAALYEAKRAGRDAVRVAPAALANVRADA